MSCGMWLVGYGFRLACESARGERVRVPALPLVKYVETRER